jgi:predicted O-methyltransferase YrrM
MSAFRETVFTARGAGPTAHGYRERTAAVNEVIEQIVRSGRVMDAEGNAYEPVSAVTRESGTLLYDFVRAVKPASTLETGMAYGLSTLFICQALQDNGAGCHIAIDPFQASEFKSVGVLNVERAGLSHRFQLRQDAADIVLPRLCTEGRTLDFAFIDGWHLFDYTLVDFYYIDKMLKVGGHVAFDDLWLPAVRKAVWFVLRNKPYRLVRTASRYPDPRWKRALRVGRRAVQDPFGRDWRLKLLPQNVVFLQKTAADTREWNAHRTF